MFNRTDTVNWRRMQFSGEHHRNQTIPKRLASVRESVQQAKSESDNGNMAASEWSDMGSRDMDCIGRMAMRLSEWEYRKLGSFGIDGYVAKVAKTERK